MNIFHNVVMVMMWVVVVLIEMVVERVLLIKCNYFPWSGDCFGSGMDASGVFFIMIDSRCVIVILILLFISECNSSGSSVIFSNQPDDNVEYGDSGSGDVIPKRVLL